MALSLFAGCSFLPEKVEMSDPRVVQLLKAAREFDREKYGFTSIPTEADVRLETRPRDGYDAMLHLYGKTSRTIAFEKVADGYRWIGEQETFPGPNFVQTPDEGPKQETICLTFDIKKISGCPLNELVISYYGEDPRLRPYPDPTLSQITPVLREWGYYK